jgi:hypothetical protein
LVFDKAGVEERPALWADLIHNCNIDFLKNLLAAEK